VLFLHYRASIESYIQTVGIRRERLYFAAAPVVAAGVDDVPVCTTALLLPVKAMEVNPCVMDGAGFPVFQWGHSAVLALVDAHA